MDNNMSEQTRHSSSTTANKRRRSLKPQNAYKTLKALCDNVGDCVAYRKHPGIYHAVYNNDEQFKAIGSTEMSAKSKVYDQVLRDFIINKIQTGECQKRNIPKILQSYALYKFIKKWPQISKKPLSEIGWKKAFKSYFVSQMMGNVNYDDIETIVDKRSGAKHVWLKMKAKESVEFSKCEKFVRYKAAAEMCNKLFGPEYNPIEIYEETLKVEIKS